MGKPPKDHAVNAYNIYNQVDRKTAVTSYAAISAATTASKPKPKIKKLYRKRSSSSSSYSSGTSKRKRSTATSTKSNGKNKNKNKNKNQHMFVTPTIEELRGESTTDLSPHNFYHQQYRDCHRSDLELELGLEEEFEEEKSGSVVFPPMSQGINGYDKQRNGHALAHETNVNTTDVRKQCQSQNQVKPSELVKPQYGCSITPMCQYNLQQKHNNELSNDHGMNLNKRLNQNLNLSVNSNNLDMSTNVTNTNVAWEKFSKISKRTTVNASTQRHSQQQGVVPFIRIDSPNCIVCHKDLAANEFQFCRKCDNFLTQSIAEKESTNDLALLYALKGIKIEFENITKEQDDTDNVNKNIFNHNKSSTAQFQSNERVDVNIDNSNTLVNNLAQRSNSNSNSKTKSKSQKVKKIYTKKNSKNSKCKNNNSTISESKDSDDNSIANGGEKRSPIQKRRRRHDEWTRREIIILLQCTKLLITCELKCVSQALYHFINRKPGKCFGRAAEKKLKRLEIFENWRKTGKTEIIKRVDILLAEYGSPQVPVEILQYCEGLKKKSINHSNSIACSISGL